MELRPFLCKNCGRTQHTTHPKKVFCNGYCKNMYHSRGIRRISQLEKDQQKLLDALEIVLDTFEALISRIEALEGEALRYVNIQGNG